MDAFVDKLAHKLTAQEMIKANSAAEAEELDQLKEQIQEYNHCLAESRRVNAELREAKEQVLSVLNDQLKPQMLSMVNEQLKPQLLNVINDEVKSQVEKLIDESLTIIREIEAASGDMEELKQILDEKMGLSADDVHKECVKVYRNVQAIVVEESAKQAEILVPAIAKAKSKASAAVVFSIIAAVAAVGGVTLQVLSLLHII